MVLSDRDIKNRLISWKSTNLPEDFLEMVKQKVIPGELDRLLTEGMVILDPAPPEAYFDGDTVDVSFGHKVELPAMSLEVAEINGTRVIRRRTIDLRDRHNAPRLEQDRRVDKGEDSSRISFLLGYDEALEIQPGMLVLAHTLESLCVPYDLQVLIEGRSRIARYGISVQQSSILHPGWCGHPMMEIDNRGSHSIYAHPGEPFAHLTFNQLSSPAETPYLKKKQPKYSGQQ